MAGGIGTRFWPMSRTPHPKQFLDVLGTGKTLIQQTYERFLLVCPPENIYVVTNESYRDLVKEQLPTLTTDQIICEPSRRNTAPCVIYSAFRLISKNPDANLVVAPSDHLILNAQGFVTVINKALEITAKYDVLTTLGIKPSRPDTGYGYIQFNEKEFLNGRGEVQKVKTFTEKPDLDMAKQFIASGDFLWNSGIFIWSAKSILSAFRDHASDMFQVFGEGKTFYGTTAEEAFIKKAYTVCKNISIDYAVMEKAKNVYVLAADIGWSDLGTWGSLYEYADKNKDGNSIIGKNVVVYDTKNCIVNVPKDKLVVLEGLEDYIVVESDGILLICRKTEEQKIKLIVNDVTISKGEKFV